MTFPLPRRLSLTVLITILAVLAPCEHAVAQFLGPPGVAINEVSKQRWETEFDRKQRGGMLPEINHKLPHKEARYLNALILENSPYLIQHSSNPVNWSSWTEANLAAALAADKLIFLSIGYSTCHWCHVMNSESFSDPAVAELINRHFVAIKVDREEMPTIDQYYSNVLAMIKGSSGWPLTAILDSTGRPIFLETYLDPTALQALLNRVVELTATQPAQLKGSADILASLAEGSIHATSANSAPLTAEEFQQIVQRIVMRLDPQYGGIVGAQKFPNESSLQLFLATQQRQPPAGLQDAVALQLASMMKRGLYDPVNGGFFRYATDRLWTVPHYEKMLYNQALLLNIYSQAFSYSANPAYQWLIADLIQFLEKWMYEPGLGYYSAVNADSDDREGFYYTWKSDVLDSLDRNDIEGAGLVTYTAPGASDLVGIHMRRPDTVAASNIRKILERQNREKTTPFIDKKIITSWNAAVLSGLAAAQQVSTEAEKGPEIRRLEQRGNQLWSNMYSDEESRLYRTRYGGKRVIPATLEDYAYLLRALIDLYDVTSNTIWLERSAILANHIIKNFVDESGNFTPISNGVIAAGVRTPSMIQDTELPAADAVAVGALWRLSMRTEDNEFKRALRLPLARLRQKFRAKPFNNLYAASVLAEIDLGSTSLLQYFAGGHGKAEASVTSSSTPQQPGCDAVILAVDLQPGWHINSSKPLQDYLKPTLLSHSSGSPSVTVEYPSAHITTLGFQEEPLSVYEGQLSFRVTSDACKGWVAGSEIEVHLQACTDKICLPPEQLRMVLPPIAG